MPDGCEDAFNGVRRPQMVPVIGGKVEKRQQRLSVFDQAIEGLVVFGRVFLGECRHGVFPARPIRRQPDCS